MEEEWRIYLRDNGTTTVRLTDDEIRDLFLRETGFDLSDLDAAILDFAHAIMDRVIMDMKKQTKTDTTGTTTGRLTDDEIIELSERFSSVDDYGNEYIYEYNIDLFAHAIMDKMEGK